MDAMGTHKTNMDWIDAQPLQPAISARSACFTVWGRYRADTADESVVKTTSDRIVEDTILRNRTGT